MLKSFIVEGNKITYNWLKLISIHHLSPCWDKSKLATMPRRRRKRRRRGGRRGRGRRKRGSGRRRNRRRQKRRRRKKPIVSAHLIEADNRNSKYSKTRWKSKRLESTENEYNVKYRVGAKVVKHGIIKNMKLPKCKTFIIMK